ncbi:MAG: PAS domain-containing protein [Methanococcoides sp.]|nr:PAS domain-containing protein [Methanococcoides sp.]
MQEYFGKMDFSLSEVPHGGHITLVYKNDDDVIDFVSSFLNSGSKCNDLCIWITPEIKECEYSNAFFEERMALISQRSCSSNFDHVLVDPALLSNADTFCNTILELLETKQKYAIANGFNGLRVNIDLTADKGQMLPFLRHCRELIISSTLDIELTILFTCPLESFSSSEVFDLMDDKGNTILKKNGMWTYLVDLLSKKYRKHLRSSPELMKKEKKLKAIYRDSPVVAFLRNSENGFPIDFVSDNISQFGYSAEDLTSHKFLYGDIIHPWDIDDYLISLSECIKNNSNEFKKEYRILDSERNIHWVNETSLIETDNSGNPTRFQGIIVDITDRKKAEAMVIQAKLVAEVANKTKSEFLANMSHELRTPLNAVIGFSNALIHTDVGPLNEKQTRYINNISKSGKHLLSLINDILDLSKIEADKMELHTENILFVDVLNDVESIVSPLVQNKNLCLNMSIESDDIHIHADKLKLKQVLFNLVSNAIKFTPEGG